MSDFWKSLLVILIVGVGSGLLGYELHGNHLKGHKAEYFDPSNKPGTIFKTYIPDMDVIVHFKSQAEINADEGTKWHTYAYTRYAQDSKYGVCEINLPSGKSIMGVVNDKSSNGEYFPEKYFPQAFSHELLHCIRGDFHE
jgi:hypothetical protein